MFAQSKDSVRDGFEAVIIAPHDRDESRDGVRVFALPPAGNWLDRITRICLLCTRRALTERTDIYHLPDPDLVPWGLLLRLLGKRVMYDVHKDYVTAAVVRHWLSGWARLLNAVANRAFVILIAERYHRRSFPAAVEMLNYAKPAEYEGLAGIERGRVAFGRSRLLYAASG